MTSFPSHFTSKPPGLPQASHSYLVVIINKLTKMGGWEALHEPRTRGNKKGKTIFSHARTYIILPSSHYTINKEIKINKILVLFGLLNGRGSGRGLGGLLQASHFAGEGLCS